MAAKESMEQAMRGAQPNHSAALPGTSLTRAALALVVIACGLSLRWCGFPLGLPAFVVKYGDSLLWATMVYLLVGVLLPRLTRGQLATIAAVIAVVVEFSPWSMCRGSMRLGSPLRGRIFSLWNLAAYAVGIAL